ncbi:MAG: hypothetical protein UW20_C0019G0005 [Candidatus Woesebacteria bacterium GW2011_GWB1_44_11]|uniref:DUF4012 domain-containing protein n=1 Tax=Candidatus Woesebacteria bacterium GW2011_GWB1_44_11 TaxID=1618579 RepID=A0A837I460_9BACT|nr:MAG: hypothetical protein UW20_C0019G0005 [Candidatus Woesebacteria bacterium GW2011_GWB1_44_11]
MPEGSVLLPKINLENGESDTARNGSTLVPKINVDQNVDQNADKKVDQNVDKNVDQNVYKKDAQPAIKISDKVSNKIVKKPNPKKKPLLIALGVVGFFLLYNLISGLLFYQKAKGVLASANRLNDSAKTQDLVKIKSELANTRKSLNGLASVYKLIAWEKYIPFAGPYIGDVGHGIAAGQAGLSAGDTVLTVVAPYADLLGFKDGSGNVLAAKTGEQTTQERIDFVVKTIPDLLPKIDSISGDVKKVQDELSQINADRYPDKFQDKPLKPQIKKVQALVSEASAFVVNSKPFLEVTPYLLGMDSPRTYLLLFQNDKELRPTGGFMTAYAIMKVDKAKFNPVSSSDIYSLDAQYKPSKPAPAPIVKYIKGPYILSPNLRLRDMNWSPDFAVSMQDVVPAVKQVGIGNIDGIIAVDTQLLVNLLDVIGPIGVPGFGNFSTKIDPQCNCPQVIHELEAFADVEGPIIWDPLTGKIILRPPNSDNRKKIIGPLMNSILANALGQPKEKLSDLIGATFTSLIEKHVLFYLMDEKNQAAAAGFGVGGIIRDYEGDYLHISDANLGGRKSNLYAYEEVEQDIEISGDGSVTKTVTITYKNPEKQDGWLNSVLPTWVRIYVPKGSSLITSEGLEAKEDPYEDLGKTVFAGFFQLRPEGVAKVTFQYKLPFKVSKQYNLLIQKQPGTDGFLYTVNLGKHTEEFFLKTDKELKIGL